MAMMRYEPWSLLRQIQNEINSSLNPQDHAPGESPVDDNSNIATSHWRPAVDIREEADRFVIHADLPGVDPNDIEVTMADGVLTLKGERRLEKGVTEDNYKRVERAYGTFYRRFSLPDTTDADRIEAHGKNGVLEIVLPKQEKEQPRRINVKS